MNHLKSLTGKSLTGKSLTGAQILLNGLIHFAIWVAVGGSLVALFQAMMAYPWVFLASGALSLLARLIAFPALAKRLSFY